MFLKYGIFGTILLILIVVTNIKIFPNNYEIVNIETIKSEISDEKSIYFYPELFSRYSANDTNLHLDDYRRLYYGHSLQPYFNPSLTQLHDSVIALRKYLYQKEISFERVIELAGFVLRLDPFFIDGVHLTALSYDKTGKPEQASLWMDKYIKLIKTIWASGNGKTPETAFTVLSVSDEYAILDALGLEFKEQKLVEINGKFYDILYVNENDRGYEQFYFDINLFYEKSLINNQDKR